MNLPDFWLIVTTRQSVSFVQICLLFVNLSLNSTFKLKIDGLAQAQPKGQKTLIFDLKGQKAKVALLAVDKAFYALKADNKLTAKQVSSSHFYSFFGHSHAFYRIQTPLLILFRWFPPCSHTTLDALMQVDEHLLQL